MPLFLLPIVPIIAAAAGYTTTTVVVASTAGGVVAGVGGSWLYRSLGRQEPVVSRHDDVMSIMRGMTETLVVDAKTEIISAHKEIKTVITSLNKLSLEAMKSSTHLHQSVEGISQTSLNLMDVTRVAKSSIDPLSKSLPALKEMSEKAHVESLAITTRLDALNGLLGQKASDIDQASKDVKSLKNTLDEQVVLITHLEGIVNTLSAENEVQKQAIGQKDINIKYLEVRVTSLRQHCGFFKQALQKEVATQGLPHTDHTNNC